MADASWAFQIPNSFDISKEADDLYDKQRQEKRDAFDLEKQRRSEATSTTNAVLRATQQDDYMTSDAAFNNNIAGLLKERQQAALLRIKNGEDFASIMADLNNDISGVSLLSANTKKALDAIDKEATLISQKFPSADPIKVKEAARRRLLYDKAEDGSYVPKKDYNKIDFNKSYVGEVMDESPEEFASGIKSLTSNIRRRDLRTPIASSDTREFAGTTVKNAFKGEISPFSEAYVDGGEPKLRKKVETINTPVGPMQIMDKGAFQNMFATPNDEFEFKGYFNKWKKQKGYDAPEFKELDDILSRASALDLVNEVGDGSYISPERSATNAAFKDKLQAGIPIIINNEPKLDNTNPAVYLDNILNGKSQAGVQKKIMLPNGEEEVRDITMDISKFKWGVKAENEPTRVSINKNGDLILTFNREDKAREFGTPQKSPDTNFHVTLSKEEAMKLNERFFPLNGVTQQKANALGTPQQAPQKKKFN